ncbi:hypothetical protein BDZ94DRAFT_268174 [Collybia nuda]|uniref:Uncharacterized protein n=1 Tax=Collybia nuda TaxID=64659 RepID=A0A9P5XUR7_9AGAR|nr:hypothetical protein BDZ94DRAFT_268174 [Collybia nuda]
MDFPVSQIPQISISPAPPEESVVEPYSPFSSTLLLSDDDAFRPQHLTPPPTLTGFGKQLSPLRPCDDVTPAKGLERERFEALLQASRAKNSTVGTRKGGDLRKEIAMKAHKNKQAERRALFLSKVFAPPSPTATLTPKTPPDSPAIFHYSLPSPGLVSPLALFESLSEDPIRGSISYDREPWVEQVDFRVMEYNKPKESIHLTNTLGTKRAVRPVRLLPSLDQISARLGSQGHIRLQYTEKDGNGPPASLPAFPVPATNLVPVRQRPLTSVGRLQLPLHTRNAAPTPFLNLPKSPMSPNLQVTTLVVPRSSTISPTELSESNLLALDSRERKAHDMLSTLRRRTFPSGHNSDTDGVGDRKLRWKRHSAPADLLPLRQRTGFEHPVFSMTGGF